MLLFSVALIAVDVQVGSFDSGEFSRISALIEAIQRLDVESEEEMMDLFTHTSHSPQRLRRLADSLARDQRQLAALLLDDIRERDENLFVSSKVAGNLEQNLKKVEASVAAQREAIRDFLANIDLLTQAQQALPVTVARMIRRHPEQARQIGVFANEMTRWQLFPDAQLERKLQRQMATLDAAGLPALHAAGSALLRYHRLVKQAMDRVEDSGIAENLALVRANFAQHYANEVHIHTISKHLLTLMVVALLLYLTLLLVSSRRKNLRLEQLLAEKAELEERNRLLLAAMHSAPNGVLVCNYDGQVLYANTRLAEMHGERDGEALIGHYAAELRGGERGDATYREIVEATERGEAWHGDYILDAKGSAPITVARTMSGIELDAHRYLVGIDRDVTSERAQAAKLEAIQRLESLGVLAGGIAHDFNNILTAIRGNAVLAKRHGGQEAQPYLRRIEEGIQRAADLCQQMLAYAGKGQFVVEPLDLSALVRDVSQLIAVSIAPGVQLRVDLADGLAPVKGDRAQLQQIVLNLITNANDAIAEQREATEGEIKVTTFEREVEAEVLSHAVCGTEAKPGRFVALEVEDNGCGMDAATQQRIFEPFFTTKFTGRGLGMSAILGIVQHHQGALLLESAPGKGSRFTLLLPPVDEPLPVREEERAPLAEECAVSGLVLIIDDEAVIREMAAEILEDAGLRTLTAEDGEQGVALFRQHQEEVDVVLLDMTMPVMDGEACFKALRAIRDDLPVVVASGYAEQDVVRAFGDGELAGFMQKPFDPERLQQLMQKIVITRRRP